MTAAEDVPQLRPPGEVMRLERMGASFPTRLSFMRQLVRRMIRERWRFERMRLDLDHNGTGVTLHAVHGRHRTYTLVGFSGSIDPRERTDRVIANVWDTTFSLFDGVPGAADIERLEANTPRQEAGRFRASELVLARANRSGRIFDHVVDSLAGGRQPCRDLLRDVGYLMRTTAVYGSGKFGCADRGRIAGREELRGPFQAELLAVYLIRWMSVDLVNHMARQRSGLKAAELSEDLARTLGIGNATGLGMAPFLVKHPLLINNWVMARENALLRVRKVERATPDTIAEFRELLDDARRHVAAWAVDDPEQSARISRLGDDLARLDTWCDDGLDGERPFDALWRLASRRFSLEGQEMVVALLLEHQGTLIDGLCESMSSGGLPALKAAMPLGDLINLIDDNYGWALAIDHAAPESRQRFWYYSQEKLEPRVGDRYTEPGADLEMAVAIGRDVAMLRAGLLDHDPRISVADFLVTAPEWRSTVRRVQHLAHLPYAEIRDNLLAADRRPVDILRFKLAFFGANGFDPKSDLWTRVTMYQGAPLPADITGGTEPQWIFPCP
ncbi:MAG: hypothetical protein OXD40_07000 [bacterium]|nr:hypothetical protein [bacterium]